MTSAHKAKGKGRWPVLLALLGVSAWLALFGEKSPVGDSAALSLPVRATPGAVASTLPARSPDATPAPGREAAGAALPALLPRDVLIPAPEASPRADAHPRDLFATRNWNPPPPPPVPTPPPAPQAPPLPFVLIGKKLEAQAWEVYLSVGSRSVIAREGAVIDEQYRVDKIDPPVMTLTYLPLGQAQTLSIGETR